MAREELSLQISGLVTNPSTFTNVAPGALQVADNIVLDRPNIVTPRRGQFRYGTPADGTGIESLFDYGNSLLRYTQDNHLEYDSDGEGDWVRYSGSYDIPGVSTPGNRIRSLESNLNFYFLTDKGTYKLDNLSGPPRPVGAPQGLGGQGVTTGTNGFFTQGTNVAYRVVWGYKDNNGNLILGAPSDRIVVQNGQTTMNISAVTGTALTVSSVAGLVVGQTVTQGSISDTIASIVGSVVTVTSATTFTIGSALAGFDTNVTLTFQIPAGIDTTWFYQVYRSQNSAGITVEPSDNLQQTIEGVPTSGQISARFVTVTDTTPETLLQAFLYTNSNEDGILQANFQPPWATDVCFYKSYSFYANTRDIQRFFVNLLSTEAPDGLQIGDAITFTNTNGGVFTIIGGSTENTASGQFRVQNTGNPGIDLQATALSICAVINLYASNTFLNAHYVSSFGDIPGQMEFELNSLDPGYFYMNCTRVTAFSPTVIATGQGAASTNTVAPNRIYWSKLLQPEAVPTVNWVDVGSRNQPIQRILPLRDGIIIVKPDGVFRLSGTSAGDSGSGWTVNGLDNTVRCIAPNSAQVLDNQVFMLTDQGVVALSENGTQIMSYPIEHTLLSLTSPAQFPNQYDLCFGVAYNGDRKYILCLAANGTDAFCSYEYCYNTLTNSWTRWTLPVLCGIVNIGDDKLYFGAPDQGLGGYVTKERKTYTNQDFADFEYDITVVSSTGSQVTITDASLLTVGMTVTQLASSSSSIIQAIVGNVLVMKDISTFTAGPALAYTPIYTVLKTVQCDSGNPNMQKHIPEISFIYSEANFDVMAAQFSTDLSGANQVQSLRPSQTGSWGRFAWGTGAAWGGAVVSQQTRIRTMIPATAQRSNWFYVELSLAQCFTSFGLSGLSWVVNDVSTRQRQVS